MSEFTTYKPFEDEIDAEELIQLLQENNILYELEKPELKFRLLDDPSDKMVTVKIKLEDFKKVDRLQEEYDNKAMAENLDHYLYTFSDKDIKGILITPSKWKSLEVKIAQKIANERGIQITADEVQKSRTKEKSEVKQSLFIKNKFILNGASWLMLIGVLSLVNVITFIFKIDFQFYFGLTINHLILGISNDFSKLLHLDAIYISITITILIAILFIGLGKYSKKCNTNAYFIGLLLYSADTIITLLIKNWFSFALHVFVALIILKGYSEINKKQSK